MSLENVEVVRRIFDNFPAVQDLLRRGEIPIGVPFAEDIEWDASRVRLPDLGDGHVRGREGVRRFWMAWLAPWQNVEFQYELRDAGEHVLALIDQSMRSTHDIQIASRYAQLWSFSNGEVARWAMYTDIDEALEAAGLPA